MHIVYAFCFHHVEEEKNMKSLKRFTAGLSALVLGFSLLSGCTTTSTPTKTEEKWDKETDFLIVGYGLAGEAAALEANDIDPKAKITVLEKMPEKLAGGNSIASGQTFIVPAKDDLENFKTYIQNCNEPNPIPEEDLDFIATSFSEQIGWVEGTVNAAGYEVGYVGGGPLQWGSLVVEFTDFPGAGFKGTSAHIRKAGSGTFEAGGVWRGFDEAVKLRENVEVLYQTPAVDLIQDPQTKAILGVTAQDKDGNLIRIKANKAVLLSCGGFENNLFMQQNYHGMDEVYTAGTPGNTGDGIEMLMKAGAEMWHMNNQTQSGGFWLGIKVPEFESTFMRNMTFKDGSWIEIDSECERFYNESAAYHRQHMKYKEFGRYVDLPHERALPVHLIFDDTLRSTESVASQWLSWPITTENYKWSVDNQVEVDKGWIIKADTIEELAAKIDRDPVELKATIDRYNNMAATGVDADYGRTAETMQKIDTPPYYAVSLTPTLVATTGGAVRNANSQVLDWDGNPIPNLYEAGELGSMVSNLYQNGVFLSEAIASGRAAAQHIFQGKSTVTTDAADRQNTVVALDLSKVADGKYQQKEKGNHGDFAVEVTVASGKITAIEVVEGRADMFIDDEQLKTFVDSIITAQDTEIDAIAGATLDCQSIQNAVKKALVK